MRKLVLIILFLCTGSVYAASLENNTDYGKMLAEEFGITHFSVKMHYDLPVYLAAHFLKEIEGQKVHAYSVVLKKPTTAVGISFLYRTVPLDPQDDTGTHRFRVVLSGYEKGKDGLERETEREYLSQNQKSQQISGTSVATKSFLFNGKEPLPINWRGSYCKLLDKKGMDRKDVLYLIDFEVSDKPIKTYEFFKK